MDYVGAIYRPPSEARSLLLQVTVGCSYNRCAFCGIYRGKRFRAKPWELIDTDLKEARSAGPLSPRVFLCDGDALILSTARLLRILEGIREQLPWVQRVGVYGDTRSIGPKTVHELRRLREAGLGIVYHGLESGDDEVLELIDKGATSAECIEAAQKLAQAGILHSVIVLLGIGGVRLSEQHVRGTAEALSEMDPAFVGALTTTVLPHTPLAAMQESGQFQLPDRFGFLEELRGIIEQSRFTHCRFSSNHASNYLPLRGTLPEDRERILGLLDDVLRRRDERVLRPEFLRGL